MFKVNTEVDSIQKIDRHLQFVQKMALMKTDANFQKFIQEKSMETLTKVMNNRVRSNSTSNDDSIELYMNSNHLIELEDGFIIYNDAKIPANAKGIQNSAENYPNGEFSIALAFEYGVGIIGMETGNPKAWEYNVKDYNFGWYLPSEVFGESGIRYMGYTGFEVYRYTAIEIETQLSKWVQEYYRRLSNE